MNTFTIDTHKTVNNLLKRGYTKEQVEGFLEALQESQLVTKEVLHDELARLRIELYKAMLVQAGLIIAGVALVLELFG